MPAPTKPLDDLDDAKLLRVQVYLDVATLRTLDAIQQANPDVASRAAAVRKLARDWRRKAKT